MSPAVLPFRTHRRSPGIARSVVLVAMMAMSVACGSDSKAEVVRIEPETGSPTGEARAVEDKGRDGFIELSTDADDPKVAALPPMGFNQYNHFGLHIDEVTMREVADAMVANGMRDAGYVYVNIDDS